MLESLREIVGERMPLCSASSPASKMLPFCWLKSCGAVRDRPGPRMGLLGLCGFVAAVVKVRGDEITKNLDTDSLTMIFLWGWAVPDTGGCESLTSPHK